MSDDAVKPIAVEQAAELQRRIETQPRAALFIDPRPATSYEQSHIAGAVNLSLARFNGERGKDPRISQFDELIVYGADAGDSSSMAVAKRLLQIGYGGVRRFPGGLAEWKQAGLPIESGAGRTLPPAVQTGRSGAR